jgi:hypothetical protein
MLILTKRTSKKINPKNAHKYQKHVAFNLIDLSLSSIITIEPILFIRKIIHLYHYTKLI